MKYCKNLKCQHIKNCDPFDFQFSSRIIPLYPNIISTYCTLNRICIVDNIYSVKDFCHDIAECYKHEGTCHKNCLWNEEGNCTRENILFDTLDVGTEVITVCRCYSRKNISGHLDWSRFPQGGNIDGDYADKLNNEATKFKLYTGSSKGYERGEHGSKRDSREMPSIIQKQAKEREKDVLRERWERNNATRNIRLG